MQHGQTSHFTCQACGHSFAGSREILAKQPTCPRCRTFGQILDDNGQPLTARQNVVRMQRPAARGQAPYAGQGGPVNYAGGQDDDVVEVRADVAYGARTNKKSLMTLIILVVLGIGIVATLAFIVNVLNDPAARIEEAKQDREVVKDPRAFEKAVDESVAKVRTLLEGIPNAKVVETTNFDESLTGIQASGGSPPMWNAAPAPGSPFKTKGFQVKIQDEKTKTVVIGFVMLLYYKTAEEVNAARSEIDGYLGKDHTNFGVHANPSMWYVAYTGVNYRGKLKDSLDNAMRLGAPASYKQFTDRMGATLRDDLKD